jgi:predicted amidohydrolase
MADLKMTLIQSELHWENKEMNLSMFSDKIAAIKEKTDLILLPEMFSTGFTMNATALDEDMNGPTVRWMKKMAAEKNCTVTGSLIISENGRYYNRLLWVQNDKMEFYDKRHLFSLAGEEKTYSPGKQKRIVTLNGWRILPLVCYDLRFPVWSRRSRQADYDLLIYVANWPERRGYAWKQLLIARAIENQCYTVGLNRFGNDGHQVFHSGDSSVLDFKGERCAELPGTGEFTVTITLHKKLQDEFREQFAFFRDSDEFEITPDG